MLCSAIQALLLTQCGAKVGDAARQLLERLPLALGDNFRRVVSEPVDHAANAWRIARCLAATNVLELLDRSSAASDQ